MPIQVDFYILNNQRQQDFWLFCCRLLQKVYLQKQSVYVHCADHNSAQQLNTQLWTFNDISFVPHSLNEFPTDLTPMVRIGYTQTTPTVTEILLNLSNAVPAFFQQFSRILEVITPETTTAGRERYRQYQQHHCELQTHKPNQTRN